MCLETPGMTSYPEHEAVAILADLKSGGADMNSPLRIELPATASLPTLRRFTTEEERRSTTAANPLQLVHFHRPHFVA